MTRSISISMMLITVIACSGPARDGTSAQPGDALPGLSAAERELFDAGRVLFEREFAPQDGLGPTFNERRCSSCHDLPAIGGTGGETVQKVSHFDAGRCDLLRSAGGDMLQQQVIDTLRSLGYGPELIPRNANAVATMIAPALYGVGLIEAIPADDIIELADPDDDDRDGISGRVPRDTTGELARFGRKGGFVSLRAFIASALLGEMGLTTPLHRTEERLAGQDLPAGIDGVADPELSDESLELLTRFVQLLAAPQREVPAAAAARDSIEQGARIFQRTGCTACHTPSFRTRSDIAALDNRRVWLFSDLLLHDLGPERASICAQGAAPSEWRTPALMGLRHRHHLLHDGSAQTARAAIEAHGGEAARSRSLFRRLNAAQQELLLRFLYSI